MLRIRLHNPTRVFTAARSRTQADWPVPPWRVLAALVSGAHQLDPDDCVHARSVLHEIAGSDPPELLLPQVAEENPRPLPATWVPASEIPNAKQITKLPKLVDASLPVPGLTDFRSKDTAAQHRLEWAHPCAWLDIPIAVSDQDAAALARAALQVGYVGRATHPMQVGVLTRCDGQWMDHTARSGHAETELVHPGSWHERWRPTSDRAGTAVRCWNSSALTVLDRDHELRMLRGLRGVGPESKGRLVRYARERGAATGGWVGLRLARSSPQVSTTVRQLVHRQPENAPAVVPVLRGSRLVGVLVPGQESAEQVLQAVPGWFTDGHPPRQDTYLASSRRWATARPVAHLPNRGVAHAALLEELGRHATTVELRLSPAGPCPDEPSLALWHCTWITREPVTGPVRAGHALGHGWGVFHTNQHGGQA